MRILIVTRLFEPSIGGVETVMHLLAREFSALGHSVRVVTSTPGGTVGESYEIIRNSGVLSYLKQLLWCDVVLQPNLSLKLVWPALLLRKPTLVTHQQWYRGATGDERFLDTIKQWVCRRVVNICCSRAMAKHLRQESVVVPNPFDASLFQSVDNAPRQSSVVFVGRLVSDKGVDVLIDALKSLGAHAPPCVIIGDGPERTALEHSVANSILAQKVTFSGFLQGTELRRELNRHALIVVPSRFPEPFGIVALEGIACGCVAIGSEQGGLPEAIGSCGATVRNGDPAALADALVTLLNDTQQQAQYRINATQHLDTHSPRLVAQRYLEQMERARQ